MKTAAVSANCAEPKRFGAPARIALQIERNHAHGRTLLEGISDYALECANWRLELVDSRLLLDPGCVRSFDGLIVRVMDDETARALVRSGKPVVDTYGRIDDNPLPSIRPDDAGIAAMAFDYLKEHRYRAFAYCGFPGLRFSDGRGAAFADLVRAEGIDAFVYAGRPRVPNIAFVKDSAVIPDVAELRAWLRKLPKPIALFCCTDFRAMQVLKVCADLGICVPQDVAVLGVDNDVLICTLTNPSLSSVATDTFAQGRRAAAMLDELMRNPPRGGRPPSAAAPFLVPPRKVMERMSTDAYQFKTPWLADAVRYIRRGVSDGVTANEVVAFVGFSHPKVNKAFVLELGHAVKREIMLQRGRLACAMLRDTNRTIGEIAERCGYRRSQYFVTSFAEQFGLTPEAWRLKNA